MSRFLLLKKLQCVPSVAGPFFLLLKGGRHPRRTYATGHGALSASQSRHPAAAHRRPLCVSAVTIAPRSKLSRLRFFWWRLTLLRASMENHSSFFASFLDPIREHSRSTSEFFLSPLFCLVPPLRPGGAMATKFLCPQTRLIPLSMSLSDFPSVYVLTVSRNSLSVDPVPLD